MKAVQELCTSCLWWECVDINDIICAKLLIYNLEITNSPVPNHGIELRAFELSIRIIKFITVNFGTR